MIDFGLLVSVMAALGTPAAVAWWWPVGNDGARSRSLETPSFLDVALGPALVGLLVGRLTTLALDDPNSLGSLSDMMIIRSGVEFWPGLLAAAIVVVWSERREGLPRFERVAALVPLAMIGYAAYEFACVFRDGCFGPESPIGLRPPGVATTMFPVGWVMASVTLASALVIRRVAVRVSPAVVPLVGIGVVAAVRSIGSIWLPHVGDGLTRQHRTSLAVLVVAGVGILAAARQGGIRAPDQDLDERVDGRRATWNR